MVADWVKLSQQALLTFQTPKISVPGTNRGRMFYGKLKEPDLYYLSGQVIGDRKAVDDPLP